MGYTTIFDGDMTLTPALTPEQVATLRSLTSHRHSTDEGTDIEATIPYDMPTNVLPSHAWAPVFHSGVSNARYSGADFGSFSDPFPSIWCNWDVSDDGATFAWSGGEKFYNYEGWLRFLITHFFVPWGVRIDGTIEFCGEDDRECGVIVTSGDVVGVVHGTVATFSGKAIYGARILENLRDAGMVDVADELEALMRSDEFPRT
jgi:hypothetical protein